MRSLLRIFALLSAFIASSAQALVLYEDTLNNTPGAQGELIYGYFPIIPPPAEFAVPGTGVGLTTSTSAQAGYSNYNPLGPNLINLGFPLLNRAAGFSLSFELQVLAEDHSSDDRAGFSVILMAADGLGIELGFWTDEIWAQTPGFTHAEGVMFDTTAAEVLYQLSVFGSSYELFADGSSILTGALRDYPASGSILLLGYDLPNFLFLGDDTSSANADVVIGQIEIEAVPVPATLALFAIGLLGLRRRKTA